MTSANVDPADQQDEVIRTALVDDLDGGFFTLYQAYHSAVFSTALRVTGRRADAEDLASDAFLRAYRALVGYPPERILDLRPRSWLLTITLNLYRNNQRDLARRPATDPWEVALDPPDPAAGTEQTVEGWETQRELAALLHQLPEDQRVAVVLRHVVDLSVTEVAEVMGKPEGTVKSYVSRGLRRLRELRPTMANRYSSESLEVRG